MLDRIMAFLGGGAQETAPDPDEQIRLAAASLLVEAARLDGRIDDVERETVVRLLQQKFSVPGSEAQRLLAAAEGEAEESTQLYEFTRVVKDHFDHDQRVGLIEMLWEVAYSDGELHSYEASLLRRVAGLIYVSDAESGAARKRVLDRLGLSQPGDAG